MNLDRIIERDGALVDGVLVAEKDQVPSRDIDTTRHTGASRRAAKPEIGIRLQILRERSCKARGRGGSNADVQPHSGERPNGGGGRLRRRRPTREYRTEIAVRTEPDLIDGDIAREHTAV